MKMTDKGCDNLRMGIVKQACDDYLEYKGKLYKLGKYGVTNEDLAKNQVTYRLRLNETKKFFKSKWYQKLCTIDGEFLIKQLDEKFENEIIPKIDEKMQKRKGA